FSSRRRHTRFSRDWSSDVCSSDLQGGGQYDAHVDNAIFLVPGTNQRIRTDVSTTVFLSEPEEYDGGELIIQDTYGEQRVKLPAEIGRASCRERGESEGAAVADTTR